MDIDGKVLSIEEKPRNPKSNDAVVGLYMFDNSVFNKIDTLEPSARGEYEITDLCNIFVSENKCMNLNINGWWVDAGTPERIIELEEKLKLHFHALSILRNSFLLINHQVIQSLKLPRLSKYRRYGRAHE